MNNASSSKRVLILEIDATGHHPSYVRWMLESALAQNAEIILASRQEMFEHSAIRACRAAYTPYPIEVDAATEARLQDFSSLGLFRMSSAIGRLYRQVYRALARRGPIDCVIVPFLDNCLVGLALPARPFGRTPWLAITMRTLFHYPDMGVIAPPQRFTTLRRYLFQRILNQKTLSTVLTIDPTLVEYARRHGGGLTKIDFLPDPARCYADLPTRGQARAALGIPADATVVLLYGEIAPRKGVMALIEAAADPACPAALHVLLAGRNREPEGLLASEAHRRLTAAGRLHTVDGYVDDEGERRVLAAADSLWIGYIDFYGMSGIMVLAGRHALPVLASHDGLIGHWVTQRALGLTVQVRQHDSVVAALQRLVNEPEFFASAGRNGVRAFERHTPHELQRLITEKVQSSWLR